MKKVRAKIIRFFKKERDRERPAEQTRVSYHEEQAGTVILLMNKKFFHDDTLPPNLQIMQFLSLNDTPLTVEQKVNLNRLEPKNTSNEYSAPITYQNFSLPDELMKKIKPFIYPYHTDLYQAAVAVKKYTASNAPQYTQITEDYPLQIMHEKKKLRLSFPIHSYGNSYGILLGSEGRKQIQAHIYSYGEGKKIEENHYAFEWQPLEGSQKGKIQVARIPSGN